MNTENHEGRLKLDKLPIEVAIANINKYSNDEYIQARRNAFGSSDSSILLGVNPYQTMLDLMKSKLRTEVSEEERAVGQKTAVKKGRDLEDLVMSKTSAVLNVKLIKPVDMYRLKEHPQLAINYDGVTDTPEQYIPVEIKIVTKAGERYYKPSVAVYRENFNMWYPDPVLPADLYTKPIEQRASYFGIPPYYYTQINQEMFGLNAPYGYIATLVESSWELIIYKVLRDDFLIQQLIDVSAKQWKLIEDAKNSAFL